MSERTNRRELILETAARLFAEQGYRATSTRQLAETVGCTEAALYYHFKGGKQELLQAVLESMLPEMEAVIGQCSEATSLKETISLFSAGLAQRSSRTRWMLAELPYLGAEERAVVMGKFLVMHDGLVNIIANFVDDESLAVRLTWLIICLGVGYAQLFSAPLLSAQVDIAPQDMMQALVEVMV